MYNVDLWLSAISSSRQMHCMSKFQIIFLDMKLQVVDNLK